MEDSQLLAPGNIRIDVQDENSQDTPRSEEAWTEKNESFLLAIKNDCMHAHNTHSIISHKNKRRYMMSSLPTTIIPLILVNIDIFCPQREIQTIGLTLVSVITGINTLYNFSKKSEVHNTYAGKYGDLASEIDKILIRKKKYRTAFDIVLEKITTKKRHLDNSTPYV